MTEKQFITKLINRHKSKVGWYNERAKHCKDQFIKDGFNRLGLWHLEELRYLEHNKKLIEKL